jgi:glycosyltransferase involved in cell wall biosynthesis
MGISVIVPARNEAQNLEHVVKSLSEIDIVSEVVICEGDSTDVTWEIANLLQKRYPNYVRAIQQNGRFKFNAVQCALSVITTDNVMIWDADNTVDIADQRKLIELSLEHPQALWTGDRLKGIRKQGSMRSLNYLGNLFFAVIWAPFIGQKIDTLCGSKIFPRDLLDGCPAEIKQQDPFGDFSLLAAACFKKIPVCSLPVTYLARTYGHTNIKRWRNGARLLKIYLAFLKLQFSRIDE